MHSCIFQVSRKPIDPKDYCSENYELPYDSEYGLLVDPIDYVVCTPDEERRESIERLKEIHKDVFRIDGDKVTVINKMAYFEKRYQDFMKEIEKLKDATLEQFSTRDLNYTFRNLKRDYEEEYGFWVLSMETGMDTLDEFMRCIKDGYVFYIGAVMDYHY